MLKRMWAVVLAGTALVAIAGCNSGGGQTAASHELVAIEVTPANADIAVDTSQQFVATGIYSDNTTADLTTVAEWSTSDQNVAPVMASTAGTAAPQAAQLSETGTSGMIYGKAEGTATIKASWGNHWGAGGVHVKRATLVSISVSPADAKAVKGSTQQFIATGTFSDTTTQDMTASVTWTSSNTAVASISNAAGSQGAASTLAAGVTTITAAWNGISGSSTLTVTAATLVSIAVTPANPGIGKGTTAQFIATGTYSDNTTQNLTNSVTWGSSNTGVATISNAAGTNGLATTIAAGSTTITAASGSVSGATTLTVTPATLVSIAVTPTNPSIAKGTARQFTATGTFSDNTTQNLTAAVTWSSSDTSVATISNAAGANGLTTSVASGSTTITAASGSISGSTTLTVTPATLASLSIMPVNPGIAKGTTQQFTATGTYSDGSTQNVTTSVTWGSSNTAVAGISNASGSNGLASGLTAGSSTITAASGGISATTTLTVNPASLATITITPAASSIAKGSTQQFKATGAYSDSSTQDLTASVTWSSSNTAVATISNAAGSNGLASTTGAGTATIKAVSGSVSGSTTLTVTPASLVSMAVSPASGSVAKGSTTQLTATGTYSDGSTQNLTATATWSSSNTAVATVSNAAGSNGLATGVAAGTTTIKAISGSISASAGLTVTDRSVTLSWDAPTTNTNGSSLTNLSGYKLYYGTASGSYSQTVTVNTGTTTTLTNLSPGTYYFTVTAVNSNGTESVFSNEVSKTIQ